MSYSSDVKKYLAKETVDKKCCQLAQIAGFLRFAGSITLGAGGMGVRVSTKDPAIARMFIKLVKSYFGTKSSLSVEEDMQPLAGGRSYGISITPDMNAEGILREAGIMGVREGNNYITEWLSADVIKKRCCRKACLRGIFIAAGTITDPAKAYHLEINCDSEYLAGEVKKLIASLGLKPRISARRGKYIVYLKDFEQIKDLLAIIKGDSYVLKLEAQKIVKETRGNANRVSNCESANLQKSVNAAQKQISDIRYIQDTRGLAFLPEKLRTAAELRLENPELPLAELAGLFDPPLAKSGLNHRLSRISQIAEEIRRQSSAF